MSFSKEGNLTVPLATFAQNSDDDSNTCMIMVEYLETDSIVFGGMFF